MIQTPSVFPSSGTSPVLPKLPNSEPPAVTTLSETSPKNPGWTPLTRGQRVGLDAGRLALADKAGSFVRVPFTPTFNKDLKVEVHADVPAPHKRPAGEATRANAVLQELKADESALLAKMAPPQQQQYSALSSKLQPIAQVALIQMMAEGTLDQKDSRGGTLLSTLSSLATATPGELADGIDQSSLVSQLVLEIAQPSSIDQEGKNTCGATTVAILLASTQPAEYGRLVAGLAARSGKVGLVNGTLERVENTAKDDGSDRSIPQRLLSPALMNLGTLILGYDNDADKNSSALLDIPLAPGALPIFVARMLKRVTGGEFSSEGSLFFFSPDEKARRRMVASVNADVPVPTMMKYKDSAHWVLATAADANTVSFTNPWGREERMSLEEFNRRVKAFVFADSPPRAP